MVSNDSYENDYYNGSPAKFKDAKARNHHYNAIWTADYRNICLSRPPEYSFYG